MVQDYDGKCLRAFEIKCGIKPVTLSQEDMLAFSQAAERVRTNLAGKAFPEDFMQEILQALEEYRAEERLEERLRAMSGNLLYKGISKN